MKYRVADLEGALLDAAVAKAEGLPVHPGRGDYVIASLLDDPPFSDEVHSSRLWEHGGPIIERERIMLGQWHQEGWHACADAEFMGAGSDDIVQGRGWQKGPTALVAAMRAYVASKYGDEVELP